MLIAPRPVIQRACCIVRGFGAGSAHQDMRGGQAYLFRHATITPKPSPFTLRLTAYSRISPRPPPTTLQSIRHPS